MKRKYFAIAAFWTVDEHQLALVTVSEDNVEQFRMALEQLEQAKPFMPRAIEIVADHAYGFVKWFPHDAALQERLGAELTEAEWRTKFLEPRPDDFEEPETCYVHVTVQGIYFSCVTDSDNAQTGTISWAELEAP